MLWTYLWKMDHVTKSLSQESVHAFIQHCSRALLGSSASDFDGKPSGGMLANTGDSNEEGMWTNNRSIYKVAVDSCWLSTWIEHDYDSSKGWFHLSGLHCISHWISGWWFGCHQCYFPMTLGNFIIPIDVHSYFSEGWPWPTNQIWLDLMDVLRSHCFLLDLSAQFMSNTHCSNFARSEKRRGPRYPPRVQRWFPSPREMDTCRHWTMVTNFATINQPYIPLNLHVGLSHHFPMVFLWSMV